MKKILFILFSIAMFSNAQNFYCTKTIDTSGCRLMFFNATLVKHSEIDLTTMTYSRDAVGSYIIKDGNGTQVTIKNDGCLVSPNFTNLGTYLNGVRSACRTVSSSMPTNLDTTQVDTSLSTTIQLNSLTDSTNKLLSLAYYFDKSDIDTSLVQVYQLNQIIDSLSILINKPSLDTTHAAILNLINDTLNSKLSILDKSDIDTSLVQVIQLQQIIDSLSALINKSTLDTTHTAILSTINDSINSKFSQLISIVDTTQTDTSLINYTAQLDTIIKYMKDTIDFEYHSFCYRSKIDSGVYEFSQVFDVKNPSTPYYMAFVDMDSLLSIFSYMNGTSTGSYPDFAKDYIPCDKWAEYIKSTPTIDTLKTLVFKAQTKRIDGTSDTLYNCKGISFSVNSGATGNITLYYGSGDQDVYDVATEQLPFWENGSFVDFLGWDASAVAGVVRINKLGCSDTSDKVCAKVKPVLDCDSNTAIPTCIGWASGSGVWFSASGCWNTGQ